ncbi:hypothetical protein F3Y22_tig00110430pilonHSYRG00290 [Hibiscus syriacus]|uniref:Isopenicillin N synthase-like Fe(2+) 2OG dioxygenase domain-containing protein n=1 Tax=Hibiscus syriacus TaxID=106335 RepID=A0A6A3AKM4_HIBSY|nr:hypothetical protein F3Y22_tig00110430pilonHSYRG00290 [Hibiscus syriacus]
MKNRYENPLNGYVGKIPKLPLHESLGIDNATSLQGTQFFTKLMWPQGNDHFCEYFASMPRWQLSWIERTEHQGRMSLILGLLLIPTRVSPRYSIKTKSMLRVETRDGNRINVVDYSSPSSFVVIAGDALMAWSNDRVFSPRHQVVMSGNIERYSLGLFAFNNETLEVPEELVNDQHPLKYKPFDHLGLLRFYRTDEGYTSKCPIKAYCGV